MPLALPQAHPAPAPHAREPDAMLAVTGATCMNEGGPQQDSNHRAKQDTASEAFEGGIHFASEEGLYIVDAHTSGGSRFVAVFVIACALLFHSISYFRTHFGSMCAMGNYRKHQSAVN